MTCAAIFLMLFSLLGSTDAGHEPPREVLLAGEVYMPVFNYSGDPWYNDNWTEGSVQTMLGEEYQHQPLMYNMLLDEVFWLSPGLRQPVMLDRGQVKAFSLKDQQGVLTWFEQVYIPDPITGNRVGKYARVMHRCDSFRLFALTHKQVSSRSERINRGGHIVHVRILRDSRRYFIERADGQRMWVGLRHRSFLNAFGDQKAEVRSLLREQNVRVRDERTLALAVRLLSEAGW
ncbi:MAG: hypothetical protein ACK4VN_07615 [Bacteroidales bacterium]